jgi:hypothetical protein
MEDAKEGSVVSAHQEIANIRGPDDSGISSQVVAYEERKVDLRTVLALVV